MRVKKRNKNGEIMKLYALERRVPVHHPESEKIRRDARIKQAEIKGEKEVDYSLDFLDKDSYYILDDVRLADHNGYFQMDSLILSPAYHLIVEVKNWEGTVIFGPNGQVTQVNLDGMKKGYKNPIPQVMTQRYRLRLWMQKHGFPDVPILYLVVISFPSTILQPATPQIEIPKEVIHNSDLLFKVQEMGKNYTKEFMLRNDVFKIAQYIKSQHEPPKFDVWEKYKIRPEELMKGVFCPECYRVPMGRDKKGWFCIHCGTYSKDAHYAALNDFVLLLGDTVSNRELRDWLQVESRNVVKRLMKQGNFKMEGRTKGSTYQIGLRF